jgi:GxxExxY protein
MLTNPLGLNDLTGAIIDAAITVHRETGPGLLEAVYAECLTYELQDWNFDVETNQRVPLVYRERTLINHYFLDLRVDGKVVIELKSVSALAPVHEEQQSASSVAIIPAIRAQGSPHACVRLLASRHRSALHIRGGAAV